MKYQTIILLGDGSNGILTSYFLLKTGQFDVILLNKQNVNQDENYELQDGWIPIQSQQFNPQNLMKNFALSIFSKAKDLNISLRQILLEKFVFNFMVNSLLLNFFKSQQQKNNDTQIDFLQNFQDINIPKEGNNQLILIMEENRANDNQYLDIRKYEGQNSMVKQLFDETKLFQTSVLNIQSLENLSQLILKELNQNQNFHLINNYDFKNFIFLENNQDKVIGVDTSKGAIFANQFVVAAENSKPILHQLGVRLPSLSISVQTYFQEGLNSKLNGINLLSDNLMQISSNNNGTRLSMGHCVGLDKSEEQLNTLKQSFIKILGSTDLKKIKSTVYVSPDNLPVVSRLDTHDNIFINTNHGFNGIIQKISAGQLLANIMTQKNYKSKYMKSLDINRYILV